MPDFDVLRPEQPTHRMLLTVAGENFVIATLPEFGEAPTNLERPRWPSRLWRSLTRLAASRPGGRRCSRLDQFARAVRRSLKQIQYPT